MSISSSSERYFQPLESRRLLAAYYVSAAGDDNANGLSPQGAWRSIDRANLQNF